MNELSLWAAFVGGLVSFASPCVLPLMPGYLVYISGISTEEAALLSRRRHLLHTTAHALFFGGGFTAVFTAMGLTATSIGTFLLGYLPVFQRVAGVFLILFGLQMTGLLRLSWLYRERRMNVTREKAGITRSFLLGMAFAFGWTPCVGPVLGAVLTMAASQEQVFFGGVLLFVYSLGLGVPFMLTAVALTFSLGFAAGAGKFLHLLHVGAGVIMLAMGVLLITGHFQRMMAFFGGLAL